MSIYKATDDRGASTFHVVPPALEGLSITELGDEEAVRLLGVYAKGHAAASESRDVTRDRYNRLLGDLTEGLRAGYESGGMDEDDILQLARVAAYTYRESPRRDSLSSGSLLGDPSNVDRVY